MSNPSTPRVVKLSLSLGRHFVQWEDRWTEETACHLTRFAFQIQDGVNTHHELRRTESLRQKQNEIKYCIWKNYCNMRLTLE